MNALGHRIARLIESQGPLSVAQFMTIALHDPADGYYATRQPLGADGDFVTAPEISQIFGELVGAWLVQVWRSQGAPSPARIVELGPGRGTLMADAVRVFSKVEDFAAAADIVMVEAAPALKAVQQKRLGECALSMRWIERFDDGLADRPLLVIANEFFDALPIRQYVRTERGWCERIVVAEEDGRLAFALATVPAVSDMDAPLGSVLEYAPAALALAHRIGETVAQRGGGALVVDYGRAQKEFGNTLQSVARHRFADVLEEPGKVDLSAHVDFAALAEAARRGGAQAFGPVFQGEFLRSLGIEMRARQLAQANPSQAESITAAVRRLIDPAEMGALFMALAILPPHMPAPPGF